MSRKDTSHMSWMSYRISLTCLFPRFKGRNDAIKYNNMYVYLTTDLYTTAEL